MGVRLSNQDIKRFRDRIRITKRMWEERKPQWERYLNYYRGKQDIRVEKPLDHVIVNYILPMVEIKTAAVTARAPVWRFEANLPEHEVRELVWQAVMPKVWYNIRAHSQTRAAYKDSRIYGFGVVRIGYRYETDTEQFVDLNPDQLAKIRGGQDAGLGFPPQLLELQGRMVARNPNARILYDDVVVERISPRRFFPEPEIDWENLQSADWIDHQIVRPLDAVKKTKRYSNTKDLQGDRYWEMEDRDGSRPHTDSGDKPEDYARVTEHHIWDRKMGLYVCFAQEEDKPLYVGEFPYDIDGYPFEALGNYPVPDDLYPLGDVQIAMPIQDELNLIRSRAATRIRRLVDKYKIDAAAITDGTMEALESDQEGAIVKMGTPSTNEHSLKLMDSRGYPSDLVVHERNVKEDFSTITGQASYARSVPEQGVETATEATILREMAGVRSDDDQAQWDDFLARIGRKLKPIIEEFYDAPRVARISPEVAREIQEAMMEQAAQTMGMPMPIVQSSARGAWLEYDRESMKMEGDVMVEAGSTAFRNRILEQRRTTEQFAPLWGKMLINQEELTKLYITRGTDFASERDRLIMPMSVIGPQAVAATRAEQNGGSTDEGVTREAAQLARGDL